MPPRSYKLTMNYITFDDLYRAYEDCRKHKKNKSGAKKFEAFAFYNLRILLDEINSFEYKLRPAQCFVVKYPTAREVFCCDFRDRIVQHFIFNELNPYIEPLFVYDTASCRKHKGGDFAVSRVSSFLRKCTKDYTEGCYILKMDIKGFFMHLSRDRIYKLVEDIIDNYYKGDYSCILKYLLNVIIYSDITKDVKFMSPESDWDLIPKEKSLFGNSNGLPIGNICSQLFANFYLNDLDHLIKSREKYYSRYVDDMVVIGDDYEHLQETLQLVNEYLPSIGLRLNPKKTFIKYSKSGITYLGVTIKPFYNVLSKSRINRMYYTSCNNGYSLALAGARSRKGMIVRYHGHKVYLRWFSKLSCSRDYYITSNNCILPRNSV